MILKLVDRLTGPAKRAGAAVKGMARDTTAAGRASAAASRGVDRLRSSTGRLPGVIDRAGNAARRFALRSLPVMEKAAFRTGKAMGSLLRTTGSMALGAAKWGAAGAAFGAGWFAGDIISTASQFEQFQVILENTEGSSAKAKKSMGWVRDFAKKTPFEVAQVMEAYVALRAYGIDPMDGTLKALGNTASGMNKQIMQSVEMLADAQTGEFERLKEFGIRAKVQGDQVAFTYQRNGKEVVRTAKNSASEIRKALVGVMDERFAGMMDRQSKTLGGMWSNLKDSVSEFELAIADAGVFDLVKARVKALLDWVNARAKDGSLANWATGIADAFKEISDWASQFTMEDFKGTARDAWMIAQAAWSVAKALAMAVGWAIKLKSAIPDIPFLSPMGMGAGILGTLGGLVGGGGGGSKSQPPRTSGPGPRPLGSSAPNWPKAMSGPRPAVGLKTSAVDVHNRLDIRVAAAPGTSATAVPGKVPPGTLLKVSRGKMGAAMPMAA